MADTEALVFEDQIQRPLELTAGMITEGAALDPAFDLMVQIAANAAKGMSEHGMLTHSGSKRAARAVGGVVFGLLTDPESGVTQQDIELLRSGRYEDRPGKGPAYETVDRETFGHFTGKYALHYALSAFNAAGANSRHTLAKRHGLSL